MINLIYKVGGKKHCRPIRSRQELMAACNSAENIANWQQYRQTNDDQYKRRLVEVNYNCQVAAGQQLQGCHTVSPFFFYDIDCRDRDECAAIMQQLVARREELQLVAVAQSASYGVHAVGRRQPGQTILEAQVRLSMLTHTEMDTNNKENNRVVFHGPINDETTPLLDDALFSEALTDEEAAAEYIRLKQREKQGLEQVPPGAKKQNKHYRPWEDHDPKAGNAAPPPPAVEGLGEASQATPRVRFIAEGVMKEKQLRPADFIDQGGRHTTVKILLGGVTQLLTKAETNAILRELMPDHWSDQNIQQLVNDFYANYCNPNQRLLKYQEELFTKSRRLNEAPEGSSALLDQPAPPPMPQRLPRLVKLLTSKTPDIYKPTVAHAIFPPLATHLCKVSFCYTDNIMHEATLMNIVMAGTGSGKGCVDEPIRCIMADIKSRDKENEQREREWKKLTETRGANKDKPGRPEGLVIQIIDSDMTKPALVTRMEEAEGHFVYVKLNELDLFDALKGSTGKQHFQLMCLAFDPGSEYGQTRVGVQSVTARPRCRFNWNASTTIVKGRRYFRKVLTDGPVSRINFCTIPEQEIGSPQPVYGQYDAEFSEALRPYISNLTTARGVIECRQAWKLAKQMNEECAEFARLTQNEVFWNLSHRACVIAWLKACVLYVANGQQWEPAIADFARWSLWYDMWCKMQFFGDEIARANNGDDAKIGTRGPQNLLELLPDEFTIDDAMRVRRQQGLEDSERKCRRMISVWATRGYVFQISDFSFKKQPKKPKQ